MSIQPPQTGKPIGANFELQTKIRVIIQQVLAATVRKLSHFNEKIDKFEDYFITFKQRFEIVESQREKNNGEIKKIQQEQQKLKNEFSMHSIRTNQEKQKAKIAENEFKDEFKEVQKTLKQIHRQNQSINSELSKTKSKFLQYSNVITGLKEEVAWKITKYLQETAENNTQMKILCQNIKNDYFNISLTLDKQKQKYQSIVLENQSKKNQSEGLLNQINNLQKQNTLRIQEIKALNQKVDDQESSLLSKIKNIDLKTEGKFLEMEKTNAKLSSSMKKIDSFTKIIEDIRNQIQESNHAMMKKLEQNVKKINQSINDQILKVNKQALKLQKIIEKKLGNIDQKIDKVQDYFGQKIQFVKMEIQSQMSSKAVKMIQAKSQNEKSLASNELQQINSKLSKITLDTSKSIVKVQNMLKESITQVKKQIQEVKQQVGNMPVGGGGGQGPTLSNQKFNSIETRIVAALDGVQRCNDRIFQLEQARERGKIIEEDMKKRIADNFSDFEQKVNGKVQKVMFLVTKIRGDSIIRNQFNDKEIKELRKNNIQLKENIDTIVKIIPGLGECTNLILSLIYDAEFQHSKIIQDNLPSQSTQKFNTCVEGTLYEYKDQKKPGVICYRHQNIKKTDIVKATFNGFIQMWEQIYQGQSKQKQNVLPKLFFKKMIEKNLKAINNSKPVNQRQELSFGNANSNSKQLNPARSSYNMQETSKILPQTQSQESTNQNMNTSFQIRKKKNNISIRQRQDMIIVLSQDSNKVKAIKQ